MPVDPVAPEVLLAAVAARDVAAFRTLYDRVRPRLAATARALAGDSDLADDVLQVTFVRIWERAGQFDPDRGSALGWMLRICRNAAIDEVRRQRRVRSREDPIDAAADCASVPSAVGLARSAYVQALSPDQAAAIVGVFEVGLTHAELAEGLGLPLGTVKSRVRRALTALRRAPPDSEP